MPDAGAVGWILHLADWSERGSHHQQQHEPRHHREAARTWRDCLDDCRARSLRLTDWEHRALYESTFKDTCVMDWTLEKSTMELAARLQVISLGPQKRSRG